MTTRRDFLFLAVSVAVAPTQVAAQYEKDPLSLKGIELYSWQSCRNGQWHFVLLPGTNREKSAAEIRNSASQVTTVEAIKARLGRLATGERVFWLLPATGGFAYPADTIRAELISAASARGVSITLVPTAKSRWDDEFSSVDAAVTLDLPLLQGGSMRQPGPELPAAGVCFGRGWI
jgi:hypothetical protein